MTSQQDSLHNYVSGMLESGRQREEIETDLLAKGHEETLVKNVVGEAIKLRLDSNRTRGMQLIFSGAIVCFLSFLLTITSSFSHGSFPYVLYGLTSVGIGIAFVGLMKVF